MELVIGNYYDCVAKQLMPFGAIMEMEDGTTQLLHISNISEQYVADVGDFITVGETYKVRAVKGKVRDVEITLKPEKSQDTPRKERNPRSDKPHNNYRQDSSYKQASSSRDYHKDDNRQYRDSRQYKDRNRRKRRKSNRYDYREDW